MKGKRKRGRQKKRWEDNIKEWTGMDIASSTRAAENGTRWKGIFANLSVGSRRPSKPGHVAQSVGHPTRKSGVLGLIPGLATYFRFSFRFFKKGSCQLLTKVCARSTG